MKYALLTVGAMLAAATAAPLTEEQYQFLFSRFSQQFNRGYEVQNVFSKYQTFKKNVDLIVAHNASNQGFTMEINRFADMTATEFKKFMGLKVIETKATDPTNSALEAMTRANSKNKNSFLNSLIRPTTSEFEHIDWTQKDGVIQQVKDQAQCGSCWAFSTTGALEPIMRINGKGGADLDLSEQFLVDCSKENDGCDGGLMDLAYDFIIAEGGVPNTKDYPYTGRDGKCNKSAPLNPQSRVAGYDNIPPGNDGHIAALKKGPVAVALDAGSSGFQFYRSGVLPPAKCSENLNHAVVMVASGEENGKSYFKIRNSWGTSWGDKGYIKLEAGVDAKGNDINTCGCVKSEYNVQPKL